MPKLKAVTADAVQTCPHLHGADPRFLQAAVTLQPALSSSLSSASMLLCARCALAVRGAIVRAVGGQP